MQKIFLRKKYTKNVNMNEQWRLVDISKSINQKDVEKKV